MRVSDFDFTLPERLIAQEPPDERGASRLLVLDRLTGGITHTSIRHLRQHLAPSDILVVNNTRVIPARLLGHRVPTGGAVECLLLGRLEGEQWDALMHPGHKLRVGERVVFSGADVVLHGEVVARHFFGRRTIRLWTENGGDVDAAVDAIGRIPLPPYIRRDVSAEDRERYQTIYARMRGSVAAPTAGLHLTREILEDLESAGVRRADITLHVGYGTFKPVRVEQVEEHQVDPEVYEIDAVAASAMEVALAERRRVVAVGTTTVRALEAAGRQGVTVPGPRVADLFIYPGFTFSVVGALLTNFHLPRSSLLMLVCAFAGRERVLAAYEAAIAEGYKFYSYGDAMLIL